MRPYLLSRGGRGYVARGRPTAMAVQAPDVAIEREVIRLFELVDQTLGRVDSSRQ